MRPLMMLVLAISVLVTGCNDSRRSSSRTATDAGPGGQQGDGGHFVPPAEDGCVPDCSGRVCGPDPACGVSCGSCASGTCTAAGRCETAPAGELRFLSLSTNTSELGPDGTLLVSALLTSPDPIVGGTLRDPEGGTYGTFVATGGAGAYELSLTWRGVNEVRAIDTPSGGADRTMSAEFFDSLGRRVESGVTVRLRCPGEAAACAGWCTDVNTDIDNCGACGRSCYDSGGEVLECRAGGCVYYEYSGVRQSCQSLCASLGANCVALDGVYGGYAYYYYTRNLTCTETPPTTDEYGYDFSGMECYCAYP
jgi:hypothetical protein